MQYHFYSVNKILESAKGFARFCMFGIGAFVMFSNALAADTRERERE